MTMAEKGDDKIWDKLKGLDVVMWAPTDGNAITRLLAALLRRRASGDRPSSLRLVAPFPLRAGVTTAENVMDLWWSPLLGEKWAAIIKGYSFTPFPFELVLPGNNGPIHDRMGLAIFQIAFEGPRSIPQVLDFQAPPFSNSTTCSI